MLKMFYLNSEHRQVITMCRLTKQFSGEKYRPKCRSM